MKIKYLLFISVLLLLSACGRHYAMPRADMYIVPSVDSMPEKVTVIAEVLDPVKNLSEGGRGKIAWPSVIIDNNGEEKRLLATDFGFRDVNCNKFLVTLVPSELGKLQDSYYLGLNRAGSKVYNNAGESRKIKHRSKKIDISDYKDFAQPINGQSMYVQEISTNSDEFKQLLEIYKDFRVKELILARKYAYSKYGSNLTEERLDEIYAEDSIVRSFADWLGRDWKLFLVYPFTGIAETALISGVAKIFTIPSIWGDKINMPGYMEYMPDAENVAEISLRNFREYEEFKQCKNNQ